MDKEKVKKYLLCNMRDLKDVVNEINSYCGALDWLDVYNNDEEFFRDMFASPIDAVRAVCYGDYTYTDDLVRFNAYGNLESLSEYDLEEELQDNVDEIVDVLEEYKDHLDLYSEELKELIKEE